MIITVANIKGGVGKTNTAIHLAAYLQQSAPTLLVDSDRLRGSVKWSRRGPGLPFKVVDENQQAKAMREASYTHIVFDTEGSINDEGLKELASGCDLLVIPAVPATADSDGLFETLEKLEGLSNYRVLLNRVKHNRPKEAAQLRAALAAMGVAVFANEIPDLAAFDKANAQGVPVYAADDERAAKAWEAFEAAGKEISNGRG